MPKFLRVLLCLGLTGSLLGNEECASDEGAAADGGEPTDIDLDEDDDELAGLLCAPLAELSCGQAVSGNTEHPDSGYTDVLDGYPVAIGNYSGPEVAWSWTAPGDEEVRWDLIDPDIDVVNHDLIVLEGTCSAEAAIARGFNDVTFEAVAGRTYFLLLDGFAGEAGPFQARLECEGVPNEDPEEPDVVDAEVDVIFSPQPLEDSHIAATVEALDAAESSIDLAMYSFRDASVLTSLVAAVERGVTVRAILESARHDRNDPDGSKSQQLEEAGIEVRWVNKVMHHKMALIDGPREDVEAAATATLVSGSANWSYSAATRYDENTVFATGDAKLNLAFQREFNLLWDNGRAFPGHEDIEPVSAIAISQADIDAAEGSEAVFTSDNMNVSVHSTYGPTFSSVTGNGVARAALADFINSAQESVWIASGHLRSRQVTDAILRLQQERPDVDIRVYLDGQEYVSTGYHDGEVADFTECLDEASTDTQTQRCLDDGVHFGWDLHEAGVPTRFKYYAYRWHYSYAEQMHHKTVIVDGDRVASGSYNMSNNAELDTMENVVFYDGARYPDLVAGYVANFEAIWGTGAGLLDGLMGQVTAPTGDFPIVFPSMALDWQEVTDLKAAIVEHCPDISSDAYHDSPGSHRFCER